MKKASLKRLFINNINHYNINAKIMKQTLCFLITIILFTSCQSQQSKAMKDQQKAYQILKSTIPNGTIATKEGNWTMTASIDGKSWKANYMYLPEASSRIIGHYNDEYIGLPYSENDIVVGKKVTFSQHNATDLSIAGDDNTYAGRQGEMVITQVNGKWVEGTFHFTANTINSSKKIEVTNGFFRFQMSK